MTHRPHNLSNLTQCLEIVSHFGDPRLKPGMKVSLPYGNGTIEAYAMGTCDNQKTKKRERAWACVVTAPGKDSAFVDWVFTSVRNDARQEMAEAKVALQRRADGEDEIRKWPELVTHANMGNRSLNPGYMIEVPADGVTFEAYALGTAEYAGIGQKVRMWAGVARARSGKTLMLGFTTTYVLESGPDEAKAAEDALVVLAFNFRDQPDGGYH